MPHRLVTVTTGRHPYEVAVHVAFLVGGALMLATGSIPSSAQAAMSGPVRALWIALLIGSGAVGLAGAFWPGSAVTGLRVEGAGVTAAAGAAGMYSIALIAASGWAALPAGALMVSVCVGACWRAVQAAREIRRIRRARVVAGVPLLVEDGDPP